MKSTLKKRWMAVLMILTMAALAPSAVSAKDPLFNQCQTIQMIVPYTAGGAGDVGARLLAPFMAEDLGLPVQVSNVPGAGSQLGITEMAKAKPDGCTIGWTHLPATINIYLDPSRQAVFNRQKLSPIAMYVIDPGAIYVKGDSPINSLQDLVAEAKKRPGKVSISTSGVMSDGHLLLLELQQAAGVKFAMVHGKGGSESLADLMGGHVSGMHQNLAGNPGLVASGKIKIITVFTEKRVALYPNLKTAAEEGYPIINATSRAISAPGGVPKAVIDRLSASVGKAMASADFKAKAEKLGLPLAYMDAKTLGEYWEKMEKTYAPLVADYLKNK